MKIELLLPDGTTLQDRINTLIEHAEKDMRFSHAVEDKREVLRRLQESTRRVARNARAVGTNEAGELRAD